MKVLLFLCLQILLCESQSEPGCINTYQQLKASLRNNRTDNVHKMITAFYPPNRSTNHVIFVHYCVRTTNSTLFNGSDDIADEMPCNETFSEYQFQWLENSLPLLIDSDVLQANTFYFAAIKHENLSLTVDPFCDEVEGLIMLETLTVWLKSYALGDEETIESYCVFLSTDQNKTNDGHVQLFTTTNGTLTISLENMLTVESRKFIIGLWLGISSLTFAVILHVGRCSVKTANAMNKVLRDVTEAVESVANIPMVASKLTKALEAKEKKQENNLNNPVVDSQQLQNKSSTVEKPQSYDSSVESPVLANSNISQQKMDSESESVDNEPQFISAHQQTKVTMPDLSGRQDLQGRQDLAFNHELDHAFAYFAKGIRKVSTTSIILLIAFLIYDIYTYIRHARMHSYDWLMLFPFPFWFLFALCINVCAFIITEIVVYCKTKAQGDDQRINHANSGHSHHFFRKAFNMMINFFTTISATTLPTFVLFHLFWLVMASSIFAIRIASSALFYIPLVVFTFWLLSITSWILREWKKIIKKEIYKQTSAAGLCKRIMKLIPHLLLPLIPFLFLPFWCLLLATLHMSSRFLNSVVDIEKYSFIVIITFIIVIVGITKKIADNCKPKLKYDDDGNEETEANNGTDASAL